MKKNLILVISELMSNNKKRDRYEDKLIRFGKKARTYLGLDNEHELEVWEDGALNNRLSRSKILKIFHAYKEDIRRIKQTMPEEDFVRVGFVTKRTFAYLCRHVKDKADVWVSDEVDEIVLGADPEFALLDGVSFIYAADTGLKHAGLLGHDGPLAEIRPYPEVNIDKFIDNIREILTTNDEIKYIDHLKWFAGAVYEDKSTDDIYPIGGHIHIGTPAFVHAKLGNYLSTVFGILNIILAKYISLPLIVYDGKKGANLRRDRANYGRLTDFRSERKRLEHRTTSGIWLRHPSLAKGVLGTAKCIAEEYYKFIEASNYNSRFFTQSMFDLVNYGYKNNELLKYFNMPMDFKQLSNQLLGKTTLHFVNSTINEVSSFLRNLQSYGKYENYVNLFIEILNKYKELKFDKYFRNAWIYEEKLPFE